MSNSFKTEKQLRRFIVRKLGGDWQAIEDMQSTGIPDTNYCIQLSVGDTLLSPIYTEGWLELKVIKMPKKVTTPIRVGLRPAQCGWLTRRKEAGGNVGVLIGNDLGDLFLVRDNFTSLMPPLTHKELVGFSCLHIGAEDIELLRVYL